MYENAVFVLSTLTKNTSSAITKVLCV